MLAHINVLHLARRVMNYISKGYYFQSEAYDDVFTAERIASPLTKTWTVGFFLAKNPKDIYQLTLD